MALIRLARAPDDRDALHILRDANRAVIRAALRRWLGNSEYHQTAAEFAILTHIARSARTYRPGRDDSASWVSAAADDVCRSLSLAIAHLCAFDGALESASHAARKHP
ncbi:MAG TPA: hypothetical protein VFA13_12885 [Candidatus Acidoferrum sp.]|nr:hypothetical protein [Candidatus Acidoferrum sp.]